MSLNTDSLRVGGQEMLGTAGLIMPASQRKTYSPTITAGTGFIGPGTSTSAFYLSMGAIKLCWVKTTLVFGTSVAVSGSVTVPLPVGFFSSVHVAQITLQPGDPTTTQGVAMRGLTASNLLFVLFNTTGAVIQSGSTCTVHVLVIGA